MSSVIIVADSVSDEVFEYLKKSELRKRFCKIASTHRKAKLGKIDHVIGIITISNAISMMTSIMRAERLNRCDLVGIVSGHVNLTVKLGGNSNHDIKAIVDGVNNAI
jgi:hypothetical protein